MAIVLDNKRRPVKPGPIVVCLDDSLNIDCSVVCPKILDLNNVRGGRRSIDRTLELRLAVSPFGTAPDFHLKTFIVIVRPARHPESLRYPMRFTSSSSS